MKKCFLLFGFVLLSLLAGLAVWLARDEPELLYSTDVNEYVPMPEGGAARFDRLLALSRTKVDYERFEDLPGPKWKEVRENPERYRLAVLEHREIILENYQVVRSLLPEVEQLGEAGPIGDTVTDVNSELLEFGTMRNLSRAIHFHTELSYWDPSLAADLNDLLALDQVIRNWAPNTRVLVHSMMAVVMIKESLETLDRILPELSREELVRVRAAVEKPLNLVTIIGNSLMGEYCSTSRAIDDAMRGQHNLLTLFFYDRHRTFNTYGSYLHSVRTTAEAGKWVELEVAADRFFVDLEKQKLRNYIGMAFLQMATPAVSEVFKTAEAVNQKQALLLERIDERLAEEAF